jgi:hypothetical protein
VLLLVLDLATDPQTIINNKEKSVGSGFDNLIIGCKNKLSSPDPLASHPMLLFGNFTIAASCLKKSE